MNIKKTIGENEFTSKGVFSRIRAIAKTSSNWIVSCYGHKILIVGER